ncbi:MAG: prefoldin subunit beta [Candidatus ainarchaeum sp.]|nr:prefoldin subunit beta [Candidatus ainarchaeum sp.]
MADEIQAKAMEFERNRNQLMNVSAQKQQLQMQQTALANSVEELAKTKEKKVYKAVGNILVQAETAEAKKELQEKKESIELRIKTLQKQEDSLINRLNKLKSEIESAQKGFSAGTEEKAKEESEKPRKK